MAGMHMLLGRISASEGHTETRNGKIQQFQLKKKKRMRGLEGGHSSNLIILKPQFGAKSLIYYWALSWDKPGAADQHSLGGTI